MAVCVPLAAFETIMMDIGRAEAPQMRNLLLATFLSLSPVALGQVTVTGESIECFGGRLVLLEKQGIFAFDASKSPDLAKVIQQIDEYQSEDDPHGQRIDEYYTRLRGLLRTSEKIATTKTGKRGRFTLKIDKPVPELILVAYTVDPVETYNVSYSSVRVKLSGASQIMIVMGWDSGGCMSVQQIKSR